MTLVIALHTGASIAVMIRAELLALPQGQWEAATALGFGYWKTLCLIILPQALRSRAPWIVLAAAGIFRDTTLISIIGLLEPIGLTNAIRSSANWNSTMWEIFIFVGLFYWFFCFCMSCYSKYLERVLKSEDGQPIRRTHQTRARAIASDISS